MKPGPALRRNIGLVLVVAGVVALLVGWVGLRDATFLADQVSYVVSGGIAGVALSMTGLALVASANTREEATGRLDRIEAVIQSRRGGNRP
jgi:hydrogenase/urease accessory protein HupE